MNRNPDPKNRTIYTWLTAAALLIAMLFGAALRPDQPWISGTFLFLLVANLSYLVVQNRAALRGRAGAYGVNSAVTVLLVLGIVGVLNFLIARYPLKADLTKNKLNTLSDQTIKVIKGLPKPVKAAFFSFAQDREKYRPLLENYRDLNPKFEFEMIDLNREPMRAQAAGIRHNLTLVVSVGARNNNIEDPNEEKLTNALIKILKDKNPTLCVTTGHGEKSFSASDGEGYEWAKKALNNQSYEFKEVNLSQEGKIPDACSAIAIIGPTKSFFEIETKTLRDYLANGGRAIFALDVDIKGGGYAPELDPILETWHVKPLNMLIVDPRSQLQGGEATIPILDSYSKTSAITKDFKVPSILPLLRPIEILPGAPAGMNAQWIAQTTPASWAIADLKALGGKGGAVKFNAGKDKQGPLNAAITVDGKLPTAKAPRDTRIVVFGSSNFATNNFQRYGGNSDFFLNAISWIVEDESLISIRPKEEVGSKLELSENQGRAIALLTIFVLPFLIAIGGTILWAVRRRL